MGAYPELEREEQGRVILVSREDRDVHYSGSRFRVSVFKALVSGSGFRVFRFRISDLGFRVSGLKNDHELE